MGSRKNPERRQRGCRIAPWVRRGGSSIARGDRLQQRLTGVLEAIAQAAKQLEGQLAVLLIRFRNSSFETTSTVTGLRARTVALRGEP